MPESICPQNNICINIGNLKKSSHKNEIYNGLTAVTNASVQNRKSDILISFLDPWAGNR